MRGALVCLLVAVCPLRASAQSHEPSRDAPEAEAEAAEPAGPPAGWRLTLSDLTLFRLNPLGLESRARFGLQKQLYASDQAIARTNFGFLGMYPKINPASVHLGLGGEIQPLSILNLRAFVGIQQYFGTVGFLQSFSSARANFSDHALDRLGEDPQHAPQAGRLRHASLHPLLQLKIGPIAMRSLVQLDYWDFDLRDGDALAYEPTYDTLLPKQGWTLSTDTDVLYVGQPGLALGLRYSLVRPFYSAAHFDDAADQAAYDGANTHHRLGLFAAYSLRDHGPSRFNKPTLVLIMSWYLGHRWRTGAPSSLPLGTTRDDYTSRAVPYVVVGFAFESDLFGVK